MVLFVFRQKNHQCTNKKHCIITSVFPLQVHQHMVGVQERLVADLEAAQADAARATELQAAAEATGRRQALFAELTSPKILIHLFLRIFKNSGRVGGDVPPTLGGLVPARPSQEAYE